MIRINNIKAPLDYTRDWLAGQAAQRLGVGRERVESVRLLKRSLDARRKSAIHYLLAVGVQVSGESELLQKHRDDRDIRPEPAYNPPAVPRRSFAKPPVVVGSGPAGLFAALTLAKAGARPLLLERGGSVEERREAVRRFWEGGEPDPENNVQFGEGGAGTFSDGKLTTNTKNPYNTEVLHQLCRSGAPEEILWEAKPHIGTDLLSETVQGMRREIVELGGRVEFHARFCGLRAEGGRLGEISYEQGGLAHRVETDHLVLATGHSARDVFELLCDEGVALEQKPFSVGVRVEHLQREIDAAMYGDHPDRPRLPPADYKLAVHLENGRGVYTFCMCPGGYVVAGASEPGGVVTNGMSYHARDGQNANSALLVGVGPGDFGSAHPLAGVAFQREIERRAFGLSGGYAAPAATVGDFLAGTDPAGFGRVRPSYRPGTIPALPDRYLPPFVCDALRAGLERMGRKIAGFDAPDAVLTGPETRSSSPVRIPRDGAGNSVSVRGLYPCGEGAGYAGGIVSAAADGIRVARWILEEIAE